jgi:tRNA threonylcarbamoyladenosine biosynthesis protein TsaB
VRLVAIDTAGPVLGVAALDGERLAVRIERAPRGTEGRLPVLVREVCDELGIALRDLDRLGVAEGPGAFTGLRVGLAAASGLAMALGIGVVPVDALASRAHQARLGGVLLSWLDARKGRVYAERWLDDARTSAPEDLTPEAALASLAPGFRATGEGAVVHAARIVAAGGAVVPNADDPGVAALARLAAAGDPVDPAALAPRYVREPDAVPSRPAAGR